MFALRILLCGLEFYNTKFTYSEMHHGLQPLHQNEVNEPVTTLETVISTWNIKKKKKKGKTVPSKCQWMPTEENTGLQSNMRGAVCFKCRFNPEDRTSWYLQPLTSRLLPSQLQQVACNKRKDCTMATWLWTINIHFSHKYGVHLHLSTPTSHIHTCKEIAKEILHLKHTVS